MLQHDMAFALNQLFTKYFQKNQLLPVK